MPTVTPEITGDEPDEELISALERCQNETKESRQREKLWKNRERDLVNQVEVEKKNNGKASATYQTAVKELTEVRAALASAKAETKLREQHEKEMALKIRNLKGELWLTRIGGAGVIALLIWLFIK